MSDFRTTVHIGQTTKQYVRTRGRALGDTSSPRPGPAGPGAAVLELTEPGLLALPACDGDLEPDALGELEVAVSAALGVIASSEGPGSCS